MKSVSYMHTAILVCISIPYLGNGVNNVLGQVLSSVASNSSSCLCRTGLHLGIHHTTISADPGWTQVRVHQRGVQRNDAMTAGVLHVVSYMWCPT